MQKRPSLVVVRSLLLGALAVEGIACTAPPAADDVGADESELASASYPSMEHTCAVDSVKWLGDGRIAVQQNMADCAGQASGTRSDYPLTLWNPRDLAHPCQTWDLGCSRTGVSLMARYDFTPKGDLVLAALATDWAVSADPLAFERHLVTWTPGGRFDQFTQQDRGRNRPSTTSSPIGIRAALLSPDGGFVAVTGTAGDLFVTDRSTGQSWHAGTGGGLSIGTSVGTTVSWGGDHRLAVVTSSNGASRSSVLTVGDVGRGSGREPELTNVKQLQSDASVGFYGATMSPDGKATLVESARPIPVNPNTWHDPFPRDSEVLPLELRDEQLAVVRRYPKATGQAAGGLDSRSFSADGSHFVVAGSFADGFAGTRVFRTSEEAPVLELPNVWRAALSPDGTFLAAAVHVEPQVGDPHYRISVRPIPNSAVVENGEASHQ